MLEGGCRSIEDSEALCYKVVSRSIEDCEALCNKVVSRSIEDCEALCNEVFVDPLKIVKNCATRWL